MFTSAFTSEVVLVSTAAVLFYVALTDLKHFKIRNDLLIVLTALFFLHAFLSGRWVTIPWNLGFAAVLFVILLYFYSMKLMGGGDLKLLVVAFLWVGPSCVVPFAVFLMIFVCIHIGAVKLKLLDAQMRNDRTWIPFAPSIAAALVSVFMIGCLRPI